MIKRAVCCGPGLPVVFVSVLAEAILLGDARARHEPQSQEANECRRFLL